MKNKVVSVKKRVFDIIQIGNKSDLPSRCFDIFLVIVIILNILVLILRTYDELAGYSGIFDVIEGFTVSVFIAEYILRIWTAEYLYPGRSRLSAVGRFLLSFDGVVDLLTILPFFFLSGFIAFRMLRVVRIFHLFRINATYDSFNAITSVIYEKRNQLTSSLFLILILMLAASLFMYNVEHEAQPEVFQNAFSGIWWSVSTLLTVGYGDIYPITTIGKILAILIAFCGVGAVAVPTGIISAGFVEQYQRLQNADGMRDLAGNIQSILIDIDSAWLGKTVTEVQKDTSLQILLISHHNRSFVPHPDYRIQMGDSLAVFEEKN